MWINILVACSNFIALYYFRDYYILCPMFASFLYHLAETKHNLPGIYPFNLYTWELLQIDRFFAILSGIKILYYKIPTDYLPVGILALCVLMYSERDTIYYNLTGKRIKIPKLDYMISHIMWHFL